MKKLILSIAVLALMAGTAWADAPNELPGWHAFVIRPANADPLDYPVIEHNVSFPANSVEFAITEGGHKAALGTDLVNGAQVSGITSIHLDRLDNVAASGSLYGPYFNIWVTDGAGNYAVIANEPSNGAWAADRWDVPNWAFLSARVAKVYETPGAGGGTSWVHTHALTNGWDGVLANLTFAHVGDLTISPPPPSYIANAANEVGSGAPDELTTNIARGFNWMFGDTSTNYVSGSSPGFVVDNYTITATFAVTNVTQGLVYGTIGAALAAANAGDEIAVSDGTYNENITIPVGVHLHSVNGAATTTIAGSGGTAVAINASDVELAGFTITNPTGTNAVSATDRSGLHIHHNTVTNIGSSALASYVHAVVILCSAVPVDDVVIENNDLSYIEAGEYSSASAITVGWSNGAEDVTNLVIQNNNIFHVRSNTSAWNIGHGAYGILINHGTGMTGKTVGALVQNNTIDDLEGLWSHGIGLEGNTPGAVVTGNDISNLVDHKAPSDAVAVMVEANASLGTVSVTGNTFSNVNVGIANVVAGPDFVYAINNDWGDASGPFNPYQNPNATGAAVYGAVTYTPWTGRSASVVADLGIDPAGKTLVTDGYGLWDGTPALGLDSDYAAGFAPGALQSNITAGDPDKYTKYGFAPSAIFGREVFVGELFRVTYHTKKGTTHVADAGDWFCQFYTNGSAHGWYENRVNAEPYFSENLTETPGTWTKWDTAPGANNRLRFFDSFGYLGGYGDGFLQDLTYDPAYADETIMVMGLGTGTPWAETFDGLVDGLTVELISGETATFNFISGNAGATVTPATTGPLPCSATATVTVNFEADAYTPDLYLFNAVVSATPGLDFGTITNLYPFGSTANTFTFVAMATGANEWTITGATRGIPGNPVTADGTTGLFSIDFTSTGDVVGDVTIESLVLRDPDNNTIPVNLSGATITYDCTAPAPVTAITASPGNNKVNVGWTHDGTDVDHFAVYSGLWYDTTVGVSAYPEYDDLAGATIPTAPSSPTVANTSSEWVGPMDVIGVNTLTHTWPNADDRGVYYYTVFAIDAAGNASAAPAAIDRATNYWLGDVAINGLVDVFDFTALGTHFGSTVATNSAGSPVDVGPTDDWSRLGIPTTDSVINFEDLMIFSLNFGVVSNAKDKAPISKVIDLAWVTYNDGSMALRLVNGSGLKGLNVRADLPVGSVEAGQLLDDQSELTFVKNIGQNLDVSVAVMGVNQGFEGAGDLFIVRAESGITVDDLHITARGTDNSNLEFTLDTTSGTLTPRVFGLNANYPNPFNPMTKISFSLPETQNVKLGVYSVDGRKVATLLNETRGPGLHEVVWTGRNDDGQTVSSGMYFYRIDAGPYSQVRKMTLMK